VIQSIRDYFSPQQRRIVGAEAQQLLDNKHFREALEAVDAYLAETARQCDPDNKEKAQRVVISMQLLEAIKREILRKVEDGEMARIEIHELERRKRPLRFER
jgi:tellurite resistance protein